MTRWSARPFRGGPEHIEVGQAGACRGQPEHVEESRNIPRRDGVELRGDVVADGGGHPAVISP